MAWLAWKASGAGNSRVEEIQQQLAIIHGMCHNQTALVAQPVTVTTSSEIQETFATKRRCVESPVADKKVADELAAVQAMRLLTAAKAK